MPFFKTFPKKVKGSQYPEWEEVTLTEQEEEFEEQRARNENIKLMKDCIDDAKNIVKDKNLKEFQTDIVNMAIALFEKRSSHSVYYKERKAKEKFDAGK